MVEQPRMSLAEGDLIRAEFLAQYTAAFDQLVAWHVENDDPAEALVYAELCRSRTFLDWIRGQGYDPKQTLPREDQTQPQEGEKSSQRIAGFGKTLTTDDVRPIVQRRIHTGPCTLYYHVGAADCYLFVLGVQPKVLARRLSSGGLSEDLGEHVPARLIDQWAEKYADILTQPGGFQRARSDPEKMHACVRIAQILLPAVGSEAAGPGPRRPALPVVDKPGRRIGADSLRGPAAGRR